MIEKERRQGRGGLDREREGLEGGGWDTEKQRRLRRGDGIEKERGQGRGWDIESKGARKRVG